MVSRKTEEVYLFVNKTPVDTPLNFNFSFFVPLFQRKVNNFGTSVPTLVEVQFSIDEIKWLPHCQ